MGGETGSPAGLIKRWTGLWPRSLCLVWAGCQSQHHLGVSLYVRFLFDRKSCVLKAFYWACLHISQLVYWHDSSGLPPLGDSMTRPTDVLVFWNVSVGWSRPRGKTFFWGRMERRRHPKVSKCVWIVLEMSCGDTAYLFGIPGCLCCQQTLVCILCVLCAEFKSVSTRVIRAFIVMSGILYDLFCYFLFSIRTLSSVS